jgi:hypothetical protein
MLSQAAQRGLAGALAAAAIACVLHGYTIACQSQWRTALAKQIQEEAGAMKEQDRDERKQIFDSLNQQVSTYLIFSCLFVRSN